MTRNSPEPGYQFSSLSSFFSHHHLDNPLPGLNMASLVRAKPCRQCLALLDTVRLEKNLIKSDWREDAANLLSKDEQKLFSSFSFPKRQREWLGGRLAVKLAVLLLLGGEIIPDRFAAISILPRDNGSPELRCPETSRPLPCISISHSKDYAVGMAAYAPACGVDIQKITVQTKKVASRFAEPDEMNLLVEKIPELNETERLSLLWSTKEALKKALLEDQPVIFQGVTLQDLNIDRLLSLRLQFPGNDSRPAEVNAALLSDYILAFTVNNRNHA